MGRPFLGIIRQCIKCHKTILVSPSKIKRGKGKYCSRKCSNREKIKKSCGICGKKFLVHQSRIKDGRGKFCSRFCYKKDWIKRIPGWNKGKSAIWVLGNKYRLGKSNPNPNKMFSEKNPNWKGGITPINKQIRNSLRMKHWRKAVFKRDNWICVLCGQHGGMLNADHIKSFANYPKLRFSIKNGRTLCTDCHKKTDTFGGRNYKLIDGNKGRKNLNLRTPKAHTEIATSIFKASTR